MVSYVEFAFRIFRNIARKYSYTAKELGSHLKRAGMRYTLEEYLSAMLLTVILIFVICFVIVFTFSFLITGSLIVALFLSIIFPLLAASLSGACMYMYPILVSNGRRAKIENVLPFALNYMTTIAASGAYPISIFEALSEIKEFGEIADISAKIVSGVKTFGLDIVSAINKVIPEVPSEAFQEILFGIQATVSAGADLKIYLNEKAKASMSEYRRKLDEFNKTMSMILQMYITLVVVGIIFAIVLTTILGLIGGSFAFVKFIQYALVLFGLPLGTVVYIVIIKAISPIET